MAQQKSRIKIPTGLTARQREELGELIIEAIKERAADGNGAKKDKNGNFRNKKFPAYNPDYAKNVKGSSNVDLELSGEMLDELKVLTNSSGYVTIGYDPGDANDKAEGNQLGSYGRAPNPKKARPFIGIPKNALIEIINERFFVDDDS